MTSVISVFRLVRAQNITIPTGKNAQHGLKLFYREIYVIYWTDRIVAKKQHYGGERKRRMCEQIYSLYYFFRRVPVCHNERTRVHGARFLNSPHTRPTMFKGMKHGYFNGIATNERSDMYPYFSLWIVDVFIGHHLLCPSPYSLSWWVRRGVQGEGAGKDLIGWLFRPTQVKWNDCYCTLHNSWEWEKSVEVKA